MIWAIVKKWRYLLLGVAGLVIFLSVLDPVLECVSRMAWRQRQSAAQAKQVIPRWRLFTNNECGYVVEFPSKPFNNPYKLTNPQQVVSYRQFASALGSNRAFLVATLVTGWTNNFSDEQVKLL